MKTPETWLIVVLAGVAVSIIAVYVVRWLDRGSSILVGWLAQRGQRRQAERMARIAAARSNRDLLNLFKMRTVSFRLRGVSLLILALSFVGMAVLVRPSATYPWAFEIGCVAAAITAFVAVGMILRA